MLRASFRAFYVCLLKFAYLLTARYVSIVSHRELDEDIIPRRRLSLRNLVSSFVRLARFSPPLTPAVLIKRTACATHAIRIALSIALGKETKVNADVSLQTCSRARCTAQSVSRVPCRLVYSLRKETCHYGIAIAECGRRRNATTTRQLCDVVFLLPLLFRRRASWNLIVAVRMAESFVSS